MPILAAAATFAGILLVGGLLLYAFGGRSAANVGRRLEAIQRSAELDRTARATRLLRDQKLSEVPLLNILLGRWSWPAMLQDYIGQAGLAVKPAKLALLSANLGAIAYICTAAATHSILPAAASGLAAVLVPFAFVALKRRRRLRAFERNFTEAIDLVARVVRAGHALSTGLEMIPNETHEPVAGEFRVLFEEQKLGLPLNEALLRLARRAPLMDVQFFVTALSIQRESGGNLAEILDNLSRVIRERFKVYGEIRTHSAQGRLTAAMLIAMPPGILAMLTVTNPGYLQPLFAEPLGRLMLVAAVALQAVGGLLLWKIVSIEA
ncbi:MAG: type II secretion system F family protein [Terriglobia bacterium]